MEEVPVFAVSVGVAVALIAVLAFVISTINVAKPVDYAYAFLYPYVKPYNSSYALLGVAPLEGASVQLKAVEINGVMYAVNKNISGLTWLMPAPCGANVTFVAQYGSAQRAETWRILCMRRQTQSLPDPLLAQLIKQLLAVGIVNPAVSFDFQYPYLVIHNLNNETWLVTWSLPNNGVYLDPPQINYEILPPNGTIEVPMICTSLDVCARGLNFYLVYPINATNLTSPLYLLYSTPSPVLKIPIITPSGVILPANTTIQYAYLNWLNSFPFAWWQHLVDTQIYDMLSTTESGGFSLSWSPLNQSMLMQYVLYYFSQQPSYSISVYGTQLSNGMIAGYSSTPLYSIQGSAVLKLTKIGKVLAFQGYGWTLVWPGGYLVEAPEFAWEDLYTGIAYIYSPYLCGGGTVHFPGISKLNVGGSTYYVENLTVYAFGYGCNFDQSVTLYSWWSGDTVTYSPAKIVSLYTDWWTGYVYGDAYAYSSSVPCGEAPLIASYSWSNGMWELYIGRLVPIGSFNVYGVNPSCPQPALSYSSGDIILQPPNAPALAIPVPATYAYIVTRSLSWAFQAVAWLDNNCWHLRVYSGNATIEDKIVACNVGGGGGGGGGPVIIAGGGGSDCYVSRDGPYDVSWYQTGPNTYEAYGTYKFTEICNGQVVAQWSERLSTGLTLNGDVVMVQDPHSGKVCGPAGEYVNETGEYIGCSSSSSPPIQSG